jgi:hypothetical protein
VERARRVRRVGMKVVSFILGLRRSSGCWLWYLV